MKLYPGGTQPATLLQQPPSTTVPPGLYVTGSETPAYAGLRAAVESGVVQLAGERYVENERGLIKVMTGSLQQPQVESGPLPVPLAMAANPQIGVGRDYFVKALRDYDNWEIKWWREVIQNSVDAGATQIDLEVGELDDGTWFASCTDNGGGMTEEILLDKFLMLGGTTKGSRAAPGTSSVGGFGAAKELILLPWIEWRTISRDVEASGAGIDYKVERASSPIRGTKVWVRMPPDKHTNASSAIAVLEKSHIPGVRFTVNGTTHKAKLKAKNLIDEVPGKAEIYHVKKKGVETRELLIRVGGLYMFYEWIEPIEGYLIAEITAPSIEIFTANRDGFRDYQVKSALSGLANRIASDNLSALRKKKGIVRKKYSGSGKFQGAKRREVETLMDTQTLVPDSKGKLDSELVDSLLKSLGPEVEESIPTEWRSKLPEDTLEEISSAKTDPQDYLPAIYADALSEGMPDYVRDEYGQMTLDELEDQVIHTLGDDELLTLQRRAIRKAKDARDRVGPARRPVIVEPIEVVSKLGGELERLTDSEAAEVHSIGRPGVESSAAIMGLVQFTGVSHVESAIKQLVWEPDFYVFNDLEGWKVPKRFYPEDMTPAIHRLAKVWTELCRYVLVQLGCSLKFGVGWCFHPTWGAAYIGEKEDAWHFDSQGEHWLLLNPFPNKNERKRIWQPGKVEHLKKLYSMAIHEVSHMADGVLKHNESFASALTNNMAECADGFRHVKKIVKGIKLKGTGKPKKERTGVRKLAPKDQGKLKRELLRQLAPTWSPDHEALDKKFRKLSLPKLIEEALRQEGEGVGVSLIEICDWAGVPYERALKMAEGA